MRIHQGDESARYNRELGSRASTVGNDIYFGPGEYAPGTFEGTRLLAHEFAHVGQQPPQTVMRQPVTEEEHDLAQQQSDDRHLVSRWYDRYQDRLQTNARKARNASDRFIEFEEGGDRQTSQ